MALKKKPASKPTASSAPATTVTNRRAIAPPPRKASPNVDLRTPIAPPAEEPKKALPKRPVRKPIVKTPEPPKEVIKDEPKAKVQPPVQREEGTRSEAPKPSVAAGGEGRNPEPRRADSKEARRFTLEALRLMDHEERYKLFKQNNRNPEVFIPLRSELPKKDYMYKDEAILRKIITEKAPKVKGATVLYCPYCFDWQVYHSHTWTGYNKCTGCGITTRDFHTAVNNGIFGKE